MKLYKTNFSENSDIMVTIPDSPLLGILFFMPQTGLITRSGQKNAWHTSLWTESVFKTDI